MTIYRGELAPHILVAPEGMDSFSAVSGYASPWTVLWWITKHVSPSEVPVFRGAPAAPKMRLVIGMTREGAVTPKDHVEYQRLCRLFPHRLSIRYTPPTCSIHSKVYVWTSMGRPQRAFLGSANFTPQGMGLGWRLQENVMHAVDAHEALAYFNECWDRSIDCLDPGAEQSVQSRARDGRRASKADEAVPPPVHENVAPPTGEEPSHDFYLYSHKMMEPYNPGGGINWGIPTPIRPRNSVNDAYLHVPSTVARSNFLPPRGVKFTVYCDDGEILTMSMSSGPDGKGLSTLPHNDTLGKYIRRRMGVALATAVGIPEILQYRRGHVTLYQLSEGKYWLDFSAPGPGAALTTDLLELATRTLG